jgi:phenol 2-monooxygenase (NADPH)
VFCADPASADIFDIRRVNRETGCLVVVRPDQYVAHVLPLHEHDELARFFTRILTSPRPESRPSPGDDAHADVLGRDVRPE